MLKQHISKGQTIVAFSLQIIHTDKAKIFGNKFPMVFLCKIIAWFAGTTEDTDCVILDCFSPALLLCTSTGYKH